ncbi:MAG TPA: nitroreductase family protein [Symbiobacteriaceae bacterium]|nr:nitroreductase family protein [Symbiobacteriaceae bacterium]
MIATERPAGSMTRAQAERWDAAVFDRHSHRTYDGAPLDRTAARALAELATEPLNGARVRCVLVEGAEATGAILTGLVGSYGKIVGAPAVLLFVGQTEDPGHMAAIGYMGQQAVLEATSHGLATCWVSGSFSREQAARYTNLAPGELVLAVSPVGLPKAAGTLRRWHDVSMKTFTGSAKRKPLEALVQGPVEANWLQHALEAARWAPSAVNGQPWRFALAPGRVTVSYEPSLLKGRFVEDPRALDCGIAMANLAVGARARGNEGAWDFHGEPGHLAAFRYAI